MAFTLYATKCPCGQQHLQNNKLFTIQKYTCTGNTPYPTRLVNIRCPMWNFSFSIYWQICLKYWSSLPKLFNDSEVLVLTSNDDIFLKPVLIMLRIFYSITMPSSLLRFALTTNLGQPGRDCHWGHWSSQVS